MSKKIKIVNNYLPIKKDLYFESSDYEESCFGFILKEENKAEVRAKQVKVLGFYDCGSIITGYFSSNCLQEGVLYRKI